MNARRDRAYFKLRSGIQAAQIGDLDHARRRLCEALDLDHEYSEARVWLGHLAEQENDPAAALRQYEVGLLFDPANPGLLEAARRVRSALTYGDPQGQRELREARRRLAGNLIFALLVPPAGFLMGVWEHLTGRTPEWRELGTKTLLFSLLGGACYFLLVTFVILVMATQP